MAGGKTQFEEYLEQEVRDSKGVYFPVKTLAVTRMLTRSANVHDLHPNPEDEFCMPEIGPNYEIISRYQKEFLNAIHMNQPFFSGDPLIVEKTYPNGYRIINGHHRWAAALMIGQSRIPIRIINLTHSDDVRKILEASAHEKRAALDLDEVVFAAGENVPLEPPLPFPWNRIYPERLRLGIPALFHNLSNQGYDIWLYSAQYYSTDSIRNYFRKYHVKVDGIITATGKRIESSGESGKSLAKMITDKYRYTIHVDSQSVTQVIPETKTLHEFPLSGTADSWSLEVVEAIEKIEKTERSAIKP